MPARSFRSSTSSRRSMDRKTADALKKEKAAQDKVDSRSPSANKEREKQ